MVWRGVVCLEKFRVFMQLEGRSVNVDKELEHHFTCFDDIGVSFRIEGLEGVYWVIEFIILAQVAANEVVTSQTLIYADVDNVWVWFDGLECFEGISFDRIFSKLDWVVHN